MRRDADYDWLEHTADIKIRVRGRDECDLYASAALAVAALIAERPPSEEPEREVVFAATGASPAERLIELLRELIFRFDMAAELPVAAKLTRRGDDITFRGRAVTFDPARHEGLREIKAVTWHDLEVEGGPDGWTADIVFDV